MKTPVFFDISDGQKLRINTISTYLKKHFGGKVVKLSIDGHFTCPNRDGTKGFGGCAFCSESGSGDMASGTGDIYQDLENQIALLTEKWPQAKYLAYFQSHTNTYAPVNELREKFGAALKHPDVIGIAIATRPDSITDEVLEYLKELNEQTFMWVELGLQSIHSKTQDDMNICYTTQEYDDAFARLTQAGIPVVTHLILGLPGEDFPMMMESVNHVCNHPSGNTPFGIKLHMFNLVKGSPMEKTHPDYIPFASMDEYIDVVIKCIEVIPPEITLHRISGDAPRSTLIYPEWSYMKRSILNGIHKELADRNTWQGRLCQPQHE